jgi:cell wall-associated NlpC family hydrolase
MTPPSMAGDGMVSATAALTISQHPTAPVRDRPHARRRAVTRGAIAAVLLGAGLIAGATLSSAPRALADTKPPRLVAFDWAKSQAGKPYIYGGTGPNGYDCSGLVYAAYKRAGFTLPRTTNGMLASSKFGHTGSPRAGELAFFGTGHVEFVTNEHHTTYGALHPGTVVWWHKWYSGSSWHPTVYLYVRHAG